MRIFRVVLALAFGLAMVAPEAHECPVHDAHTAPTAPASHHDASAPGHHEDTGQQHAGDPLCTCPQACCAVGVGMSLPQSSGSWSVVPRLTRFPVVTTSHSLLLSPRKHFLPFALAPPQTLV
jgi:hypothetical protein